MNSAAFFEFVFMMVMMVGRQIPYLIQFGRLRAKAHQILDLLSIIQGKGGIMDALGIMLLAFAGYIIMYKLYGQYIGRKVFALSASAKTPAYELEDGMDYVPAKKEVIFGHHFTSIAGTGLIVGPAIAIIWGWLSPLPLPCILSP